MTALSTHKLTLPEGEGWANQGVGELARYLGEQQGTWGTRGGRDSPREIITESRQEFLLRPCS